MAFLFDMDLPLITKKPLVLWPLSCFEEEREKQHNSWKISIFSETGLKVLSG